MVCLHSLSSPWQHFSQPANTNLWQVHSFPFIGVLSLLVSGFLAQCPWKSEFLPMRHWKRGSGPLLWITGGLFVPGWLISWSADHTGNAAALWLGKNAEDEVHGGETFPQPCLQPSWGLVSSVNHETPPDSKNTLFIKRLLYYSVRSTNIVRTIESARCLIAGLFQQKQKGRGLIYIADLSESVLLLIPSVFVVFLYLQMLWLY